MRLIKRDGGERADAEQLVLDHLLVSIGLGSGKPGAELLHLHLASAAASQFALTFNSTHVQLHTAVAERCPEPAPLAELVRNRGE